MPFLGSALMQPITPELFNSIFSSRSQDARQNAMASWASPTRALIAHPAAADDKSWNIVDQDAKFLAVIYSKFLNIFLWCSHKKIISCYHWLIVFSLLKNFGDNTLHSRAFHPANYINVTSVTSSVEYISWRLEFKGLIHF